MDPNDYCTVDLYDNNDNNDDTFTEFSLTLASVLTTRQSDEHNHVYLSFYTPQEMTSVAYLEYGKRWNCLYNAYVAMLNFFILCNKWWIEKNNEFTVWMTRDPQHPEYNYSHVEISTEDHTYYAKWGSKFSKMKGKLWSPNKTGTLRIRLSGGNYAKVVHECEKAVNEKQKFNYLGNAINFAFPEWLRKRLFANGVYENENTCFCSELIARALIKTSDFEPLFKKARLVPAMTSPIALFKIVKARGEADITAVTMTTIKNKPQTTINKKKTVSNKR